MSQPNQYDIRNRLLSAIPAECYAQLRPHLEALTLEKGAVLIGADQPFDYVHFPDHGIGSIVTATLDSRRVETGLFGRDGMSGVSALLGATQMSQTTIIQVAGAGHRITVAALKEAIAASPVLLEILLPYIQTLITQTSFTALSNVNQSIEERLARWLLMCHDRIDGDEIPLTHEFLSIMLAVQRPSVTTALHILEGNGFIRAKRGQITVLDREALIEFADGTYGAPEAEYLRLLGKLQ